MIDEGFYFFDNGSFGEFRGFRKYELPDSDKQQLMDENSRNALSNFSPPPGLSPSEYTSMFQAKFLESRNKVNDEVIQIPFTVQVQVGNAESLAEIERLEQHQLFIEWEQPHVVEMYKKFTSTYINEQK